MTAAPFDLKADCFACIGLCCVAPGFDEGEEFAFSKPALAPCRHLGADNLCRIHEDLSEKGFPACASFDCKGAGQYVSKFMFPRKSWRGDAERLEHMADAYRRMRVVCDLAELLRLAATLPLSAEQDADRRNMLAKLLPDPPWSAERLGDAEADGLFKQAQATLSSFRDAALRR